MKPLAKCTNTWWPLEQKDAEGRRLYRCKECGACNGEFKHATAKQLDFAGHLEREKRKEAR